MLAKLSSNYLIVSLGTLACPVLAFFSVVLWFISSTWTNCCFSVCLGWPKLLWFVTESKHLSKPPRDWFPHIKDANNDTAYIEVTSRLCSMTREQCVHPITLCRHSDDTLVCIVIAWPGQGRPSLIT